MIGFIRKVNRSLLGRTVNQTPRFESILQPRKRDTPRVSTVQRAIINFNERKKKKTFHIQDVP
jgi:hypothetical protein